MIPKGKATKFQCQSNENPPTDLQIKIKEAL